MSLLTYSIIYIIHGCFYWSFILKCIFSCIFACLVIFIWMSNTMHIFLLGAGYFWIHIHILELLSLGHSCCCLVTKSCLTLCNPMGSIPGSFVHLILQARILEWVAISFSWGARIKLLSPALAGEFFTTVLQGKPRTYLSYLKYFGTFKNKGSF